MDLVELKASSSAKLFAIQSILVSNGPGGVESKSHADRLAFDFVFLMDLVELKVGSHDTNHKYIHLVSNGPGGVERFENYLHPIPQAFQVSNGPGGVESLVYCSISLNWYSGIVSNGPGGVERRILWIANSFAEEFLMDLVELKVEFSDIRFQSSQKRFLMDLVELKELNGAFQ